MNDRSPAMRRADRRSLLLLTLAVVPAIVVAWFSLQQWNDNGQELAAAEEATGPVSSMYYAYTVVDLMSRMDLLLVAASSDDASPAVRLTAKAEMATFDARLDTEIAQFKQLLTQLDGSFSESPDQTLELLTLAGGAAKQAIARHEAGEPPPPILRFVVAPARDQLINIVAPAVSSPVPEVRETEQLLIELMRLDTAHDIDLYNVLQGTHTLGDLELDSIRRPWWRESAQEWTLSSAPMQAGDAAELIDRGTITERWNPITPPLIDLAELGADANLSERRALVAEALRRDIALAATMEESNQKLQTQAIELRNELRQGRTSAAIAGLLMTAFGIALFGLIVNEVQDRRRTGLAHDAALAEMGELANCDALTGLRNRRWLDIELARALADRVDGQEIGIVYADLDRFKGINDVWGHEMGDVVLRVVANRMRNAARAEHDFELVRFGGDEFVGLARMPAGSDDADLERIGALLLSAFDEPITFAGKVHNIEGSIGLTRSSPESTPHSLLVEADLSLLEAKRTGRGRAVMYQQHGNQVGELVQALPTALAGGEFSMHLQPVVSVATGEIVHFEALARWTRPGGQIVSPAVFVPLVESFGLAEDLTRAMLVNVSDLLVRAQRPLPRIWVNVSPVEFNGADLSGRLLGLLDELKISPHQIGIEMTERSAIGDLVGVEDELMRLRERGVEIAIDDFGAGYSPLGHLRELPVHTLKIDRSLIANVDTDTGAQQIVRGITGFARSLGLQLVAEGVERVEEHEFLQAEGIDMMQGWLTGRPAPAEEAIELLAPTEVTA